MDSFTIDKHQRLQIGKSVLILHHDFFQNPYHYRWSNRSWQN